MTFPQIKQYSELSISTFQFTINIAEDPLLIQYSSPRPVSSQSPSCFLFGATELSALLHANFQENLWAEERERPLPPPQEQTYSGAKKWPSLFS